MNEVSASLKTLWNLVYMSQSSASSTTGVMYMQLDVLFTIDYHYQIFLIDDKNVHYSSAYTKA